MAADGHAGVRRKPLVTPVPIGAPAGERARARSAAKPTPAGLGVDLSTLDWQRSGAGPGSFEVAFVAGQEGAGQEDAGHEGADQERADWVLLRVAGDPAGRILVYDRNEWECFLDGAEHGEFDWPEGLARRSVA